MFNNEKIVAIIPARKGSKRLKKKNGIVLGNKKLFEYSIDVANNSKYIDEIIFSTDSQEWLEIAIKKGCLKNKLREKMLSKDDTKTIDVLLYEIRRNKLRDKFFTLILLQPTSPYRTVKLVDGAIEKYFEKKEPLISVVKCKETPIFMRTIQNGKLKKILDMSSEVRSQEIDETYRIIGNIYINNIEDLNKNTILNENTIPYIIEEKYAIDIDCLEDLKNAEKIMKENKVI